MTTSQISSMRQPTIHRFQKALGVQLSRRYPIELADFEPEAFLCLLGEADQLASKAPPPPARMPRSKLTLFS
jgi:hypothetical protein